MRFKANASRGSILVFLLVLSVASTLIGPRLGRVLRPPMQSVLAPLTDGPTYLGTMFRAKLGEMTAKRFSQDEARQLAAENQALGGVTDALRAELEKTRSELARIQQLDHLLFGHLNDIPCELVSARVVGSDSLSYGQTRTVSIRKASNGLPVTTRLLATDRSKALPKLSQALTPVSYLEQVAQTALVGRLIESGEFTARLQLVTDRGFVIRARIQRRIDPSNPRVVIDNGVRTTLVTELPQLVEIEVKGNGSDSMLASNVKDEYNIQAGDLLVTCNDDVMLPAQVRIGEVAEKRPASKGGFVDLRIKPLADLDGLRDVYVVVPRGGPVERREGAVTR